MSTKQDPILGEEIKIKLPDRIINAVYQSALHMFDNVKPESVNFKASYYLGKTMRSIADIVDRFSDDLSELDKTHFKTDPEGNFVRTDDGKLIHLDRESYEKERNRIFDREHVVTLYCIGTSTLDKIPGIYPPVYEQLIGRVVFMDREEIERVKHRSNDDGEDGE